MKNIRDYIASKHRGIENPGEVHCLNILLIDVSESMVPLQEDVRAGISRFFKMLREDPAASGCTEVCVIVYADEARVLVPFGPVYGFEMPRLEFGGMTAGYEAKRLALEVNKERKEELKANHTAYRRTNIFDITDGRPNDPENGVISLLRQSQTEKHCNYIPIYIREEPANDMEREEIDRTEEQLRSMVVGDHPVLKSGRDNFEGIMNFLHVSISDMAQSSPGTKVTLNPQNFQLEV